MMARYNIIKTIEKDTIDLININNIDYSRLGRNHVVIHANNLSDYYLLVVMFGNNGDSTSNTIDIKHDSSIGELPKEITNIEGSLIVGVCAKFKKIQNINNVGENIFLSHNQRLHTVQNIKCVRGSLWISSCPNFANLNNIHVRGDIRIEKCSKIKSICSSVTVDGWLFLSSSRKGDIYVPLHLWNHLRWI